MKSPESKCWALSPLPTQVCDGPRPVKKPYLTARAILTVNKFTITKCWRCRSQLPSACASQ